MRNSHTWQEGKCRASVSSRTLFDYEICEYQSRDMPADY